MSLYSLLLLLLLAFSPLSFGASSNNPCMKDVDKFCKGTVPGQGRIAKCMKDHASELSPSCKQYGENYMKQHPGMKQKMES